MIVKGKTPTAQYRKERRDSRYSYREICDLVSGHQFIATGSQGKFLVNIYNIHEFFTEQEFRSMMRYNNFGEGAHANMYSELDAELLYAIVKNLLSVRTNVDEYFASFSSDNYYAVSLEEENNEVAQKLEKLIATAYEDMRHTEVETVEVMNIANNKDRSGMLQESIRAAAVEWKNASVNYQNRLKELLGTIK